MNSEHRNIKIFTTEFHGVFKFKSSYSSVLLRVLCGLIICFIYLSCSSQKLPVEDISIERNGEVIAVVKAEIARTDEERAQGLMFRKSLPDGEGMFFIFDRDQVLSFWMRNTYIPLSIAYIASDGIIIDILNMHPHDETRVTSSRSVRYALEVPQNWFSRTGVQEGDMVQITKIN